LLVDIREYMKTCIIVNMWHGNDMAWRYRFVKFWKHVYKLLWS